jgi:hypothetical protein
LFAIPAVLSAAFLAIAAHLNAFSFPLAALILAYTFLPTAVAYLARETPPPTWLDFVIIALLWFPLEFSIGHQFIPSKLRARCIWPRTAFPFCWPSRYSCCSGGSRG